MAYLFDAGAGVVRNAIIAAQKKGISELDPLQIKHVFFTHIHSDHTIDLSELVQTMWFKREGRIDVYGPGEIEQIVNGMNAMIAPDIEFRMHSLQPVPRKDPKLVDAHVIKAGVVYQADSIHIEAFLVEHGDLKPSFGYKVVTPDKTIVISGDTTFSKTLIDKAKGADVLVHEVMSEKGVQQLSDVWQKYHRAYHTTTTQVAEIAKQTRPKLLVLYHLFFAGVDEDSLLNEVKEK